MTRHPSVLGSRARSAAAALVLLLLGLSTFLPLHSLATPTAALCSPYAEEQATPANRSDLADAAFTTARAQHLARLGVDRWHTAGNRGRGIKVAVLDSGFRGYRDFLGKVLPEKVVVRSFRKDGDLEARDSQHGILCAEVIHTLAPEAELLFANWEADDAESFLDAVRWAKEQGARVVSCSVIMPSMSDGEGGGPVHEALARVLGPGAGLKDILFFVSAGNTAERHWAGLYHGVDGSHEWRKGVVDNVLTPWGDERVSIELCCKRGSSYEVVVLDHDGTSEVAHTGRSPADGGPALVRFEPEAGHCYQVRVHLVGGKPGPFHLTALHTGLREATAAGSVVFPADGLETIAVGAVNRDNKRTAYSACGSASCRTKPDLVAPVPFLSAWRTKPFAGTSAAAPQAAALGTLLWSRNADWTAEKVRGQMAKAALDLGPPGHDSETGYGLVRLP
jgi:subtilisin family serine protease